MVDLPALVPDLRRIAALAGERILELYGSEAVSKSDGTPVTAADHASQETILAALRELTPDIPILSEEAAEIPYSTRREWPRLWVVDPLDGTKEFLKRSGEFTVNIALVEQGAAVAGVVYAPAIATAWTGYRGGAATVHRDGVETEIHAETSAAAPIRLAVSRDHLGAEENALIERLGETTTVSAGSSIKFCLIAEGRADVYPRFVPTMEWDTAAAQAVLEAAGGHVTQRDGSPLTYNRENLRNPPIIAWADPRLFEQKLKG